MMATPMSRTSSVAKPLIFPLLETGHLLRTVIPSIGVSIGCLLVLYSKIMITCKNLIFICTKVFKLRWDANLQHALCSCLLDCAMCIWLVKLGKKKTDPRWFYSVKNRNASTGPFNRLFAHSLAPLTHLLPLVNNSLLSWLENVIFDVPKLCCSEP